MRCSRCGTENPETHRYCGSCGASLPNPVPAGAQPETATSSAYRSSNPSVPRPTGQSAAGQRSTPQEAPSISGPSFLGLGAAPSSKQGPNLRHDSRSDAARNLDYLLEDDEPRSGKWKFWLILVALALAGGFGYLRWHNELSSLIATTRKPTAAQPAESSAPAESSQPEVSTPANGPAAVAPGTTPPAVTPAPQPSAQPSAAPSTSEAGKSASSSASTTDPNAAATPPNSAPAENAGAAAEGKAENSEKSDASAPPAKSDSETENSDSTADSTKAAEAEPAPAPAHTKTKPSAAKPFDQVREAEKYIYGRGGAKQDCDRGLRMLRPPADKGNLQAMISLGALYSTGVCAPKDLPTAYRWFAVALRKQPDNPALQDNLKRLWGQMTQPERQLAIKLSQ
ncbi:MAG TPA: zinc-ribbon domain-containing protein [Candidatus Sulfotelmatobacter sp.]|nr:zinc-ribbon domain-containing protein [Candidatus Sulfotelmatobacter sp.]